MKKQSDLRKARVAGKSPKTKKEAAKTPEPVIKVSNRANWLMALFLLVFAVLLYGSTVKNQYAVDDNYVTNNAQVKKGIKALPEIFTTRYYSQQGNVGSASADYRPVVKATFAIEYQLWGDKPNRSHAMNVLIYWFISVLVYFILKRLFSNYNFLFPFLITLLFMAHPIHSEVVVSLKNRDEMLAFLAGLGSLWFILNYARSRNLIQLVWAFLIFIAGYLSKTSILPFLMLYPLVLYFFTDVPVRKIIPILGIILVAIILAQFLPRLYLPPFQRSANFIENPLFVEKSLWLRLGTGMVTLWFYLKMLFYPHPMLYYYGYNMIPVVGLTNLWALLSLVIHGGLLFIAIRKFREKSVLSFAILWYFIAIAMYTNIVTPVVGIVGERFVFNASLGFSVAVVYLVFMIFRTDPKRLTLEMDERLKIFAVVLLLLIPATLLANNRSRNWRNILTLYRHDIKSLNNSAKANLDYAGYLMSTVYSDPNFLKKGLVNELKYFFIVQHFKRSLELYPDNYQAINDLGTVYLFIGKNYDSAVYFLQKAIKLDSTLQPAWVNLGLAYRQQGKYDKAIGCYEHILSVNPRQIKARFALADVYNDLGDFNKAVQMNEDLMKEYPNLEMPYVNIGNYYMLKADTIAAVSYWEKAAAINPTYELCLQLNSLYIIKGDRKKADYFYDLGLKILNQNR